MAKQLFKNNATTVMSGSLTQGGTTLVLATGTGDRFPSPTNGDWFLGTLFEKDEAGDEMRHEVVRVTARVADTLTIARDEEGITGQSGGFAYPSAVGKVVFFDLRWTAAGADNFWQRGEVGTTPGTLTAGDHNHDTDYQQKLVSATNIKTINGGSILGSGDVAVAAAGVATTFTATQTFTGIKETVYALNGTEIAVSNGTIQYKTLAANTTLTESLADGEAVTLMLNPGTYTTTWPTITWAGGTAPTLTASKYNTIVLWQVGGTVYGKFVGVMG